MILAWLILVLVVGGLAAWLVSRWHADWARRLSLAAVAAHLVLLVSLCLQMGTRTPLADDLRWLADLHLPWIAQLGIGFDLALDGLSLLLLLLTDVLGIAAIAASWKAVTDRVGFFHFNLLWLLAAMSGVFLAVDLFLFYVFWELMLVPLYFLILIWGHEGRRVYAAIKFFIYTQVGGLLMLLAILGLHVLHGRQTGVDTFLYDELLGTEPSGPAAMWLMLGFVVAFAVKLPVVPLHTWLPDAHTEAPTAGSVLLAGLVLKAGAYGLIRFVWPLFPAAASDLAPWAMLLGTVSILYGAVMAFGQTDLKRLVAYTSVSHMGFVLLGVFAGNRLGLQGAVVVILAHGLSTGALFILAGNLYERLQTRDLRQMGGLWSKMPRMGTAWLIFALASLGLPGLGNFVGEFLVLLGAFQANVPIAVLATLGFVVSTAYSLLMMQRVFHGSPTPLESRSALPDLSRRESAVMALLVALIVWLGLFPQPVLDTGRATVDGVLERIHEASQTRFEAADAPRTQPPQMIATGASHVEGEGVER
ncbi:MAG: NADH-quinone oxidoreductase subunit M [Planctomycetaceae bacterium]